MPNYNNNVGDYNSKVGAVPTAHLDPMSESKEGSVSETMERLMRELASSDKFVSDMEQMYSSVTFGGRCETGSIKADTINLPTLRCCLATEIHIAFEKLIDINERLRSMLNNCGLK